MLAQSSEHSPVIGANSSIIHLVIATVDLSQGQAAPAKCLLTIATDHEIKTEKNQYT